MALISVSLDPSQIPARAAWMREASTSHGAPIYTTASAGTH